MLYVSMFLRNLTFSNDQAVETGNTKFESNKNVQFSAMNWGSFQVTSMTAKWIPRFDFWLRFQKVTWTVLSRASFGFNTRLLWCNFWYHPRQRRQGTTNRLVGIFFWKILREEQGINIRRSFSKSFDKHKKMKGRRVHCALLDSTNQWR